MFIVAFDPNEKNTIRAVYKIPDGMNFQDAESTVQKAYQGSDNEPEEVLENEGFLPQPFISAEVNS